jgi:hypothetical protein
MEKMSQRSQTYQTDKKEEHEESPPQNGLTVDISIAHSGHGDDKKVDTSPVGDPLRILEI